MTSWRLRVGLHPAQVLGERLAGDGQAVAVQQPLSSSIFISGTVPPILTSSAMTYAARLEVGQHGHARADAGEVIEVELDAGGRGHGEQMQDGVGRAAEAITTVMAFSKASRVRISRGLDAALDQFEHGRAGFAAVALLVRPMAAWAELLGRLRPRASMAEAMVLAVYMPPQEPAPGMAHSSIASARGRRSCRGVRADRLEDRHDVDVLALVLARQDRAAVDEHRGRFRRAMAITQPACSCRSRRWSRSRRSPRSPPPSRWSRR
jgi:hypothetical protein